MCGHCVLKHVPYEQVFLLLDEAGGEGERGLAAALRQQVAGVGQSKCSEDSVGVGRRAESAAQNPNQGTAGSVFQKLVNKKMASEIFHYQGTGWEGMIAPSGMQAKLGWKTFDPKWSSAPQWVRQLRSSDARTSWFSPSRLTMHLPDAELRLLEADMANGNGPRSRRAACFRSLRRRLAWPLGARTR